MSELNVNEIGKCIEDSQPYAWNNNQYNFTLNRLLKVGKEINSSVIYDGGLFSTYFRVIRQHLAQMPEKTLEVGPGRSVGASLLLALAGVREAHTLDPFPNLNFDIVPFAETLHMLVDTTSFIRQILDKAVSVTHVPGQRFQDISACNFSVSDFRQIDENTFMVRDNKVRHFPGRFFETTDLEGDAYDFIFSHAALEHVRNPEDCARELARLLRKGGVTAHQVDLRDHRDFSQPLEFLKDTEESWEKKMEEMCKYDGSLYMNRWRKSEWISVFRKNGFDILECEPNMKYDKAGLSGVIPQLNGKYRNMDEEDLEAISMFIVARLRD